MDKVLIALLDKVDEIEKGLKSQLLWDYKELRVLRDRLNKLSSKINESLGKWK